MGQRSASSGPIQAARRPRLRNPKGTGAGGEHLKTWLGYVLLWRLRMLCPLEPTQESTQDPDPSSQNLSFQVVIIRRAS